jgi:putative heme-binding domain-containing protein
LKGKGGLVGPQLTGIGNRGAERLCEDILDPNRNVDHAFRQTILTLKSGDSLAGLFRRDDGAQVILANATGAEMAVARADIAERRESDLSLMPDNFAEAISETDFVNLMAFLLAQRGN